MNLRFVEAYYWVVTLKSVSRAAEKLCITQSAMSARIAALEEELGVLLLDRSKKQFHLTIAGGRFFGYAQKLLALQRETRDAMGSDLNQAISLRIGAIESVLHSWLIPWIETFRQMHPSLELELTVETTPVLTEQISRGMLDLVFAALPATGDGLRATALPAMALVFVGNPLHHKKRQYTLKELVTHELLTFQKGSQPHAALLDLLRKAGIDYKRIHTISSISAMLQLVQGGFGIATLPEAALDKVSTVQKLKKLRCNVQLAPLPIHASWRTDPGVEAIVIALESALRFVGVKSNKSMTI